MWVSALVGCSKPDYSKPHEYIDAIGYGENWAETQDNEYKLRLSEGNIRSFFELGAGKCEEYLNDLDAEKVYVQMAATNLLIRSESEGKNDTPIKYVKLQCMAYHGLDQGCEEKRLKGAESLAKSIDMHEAETYLLKTWGECRINKEIGRVRTFSLDDSKKYKYVP